MPLDQYLSPQQPSPVLDGDLLKQQQAQQVAQAVQAFPMRLAQSLDLSAHLQDPQQPQQPQQQPNPAQLIARLLMMRRLQGAR